MIENSYQNIKEGNKQTNLRTNLKDTSGILHAYVQLCVQEI